MDDSLHSCPRLMLLAFCVGAQACAAASPHPASDAADAASGEDYLYPREQFTETAKALGA